MRIHILSDLHLECAPDWRPPVVDADLTILAGDVHTKARGVEWAAQTFRGRVVYIPGNHEFYGGHLTHTLAKLKRFADDTTGRVTVLQRDVLELPGVRILGATGWTDFTLTGNQPLAMLDAAQRIRDYKKIRWHAQYRKLKPEVLALEAVLTQRWLREQLATPFDGKTIVVTHHAPCAMSIQASEGHLDAAYANRWESLFGEDLALWVHGHTHNACDYELYGTRVICNPVGYPFEADTGYQPDLIVEV